MEENIREAMTAAHDNMQEKMQEKVAEVKNTLDSLEGTSRANRFTVTGYTIYNAVLLVCYLADSRIFRNLRSPFHPFARCNLYRI